MSTIVLGHTDTNIQGGHVKVSLPLKIRSGLGSGIGENQDTQKNAALCESFTERHWRDSNARDWEFPTLVKVTKGDSVLIQKVRANITPEGAWRRGSWLSWLND